MPVSNKLTLKSPAKINRFLHICGRRSDGYHNLQTVFQFVDFYDTLHFEARADNNIILSTQFAELNPNDNLIVRAAQSIQTYCQRPCGVTISIEKKLPMGAGIGGGSSNAATTLVALNRLWQLGLEQTQLINIGLTLGADVPIFIHGKSAWAEGVGEKLSDIQLDEPWYLLLFPACHVATKKIFSHKLLTRDTEIKTIATFLEPANQNQFKNDCEKLVRELYPQVDQAFKLLNQFANAQMTGTGACIYALFEDEQKAREVAQQLPSGIEYRVCKGSNLSALYK